MTTSQPLPTIVCADSIRALYPDSKHQITMTLKAVAICGAFFLFGALLKMEWLGVIGIALVGGLFVIPHVMRINRFMSSLPCVACGLPAGKYTTVKFILYLECTHCGHLSQTDCMMIGPGRPTKV